MFTFIGQTMASIVAPCEQMGKMTSHMEMMDHEMANNMMLESVSDQSSDTELQDCCKTECKCPMGMCATATLTTLSAFNHSTPHSQKINQYSLDLLSQSLSSLYHPPIFS